MKGKAFLAVVALLSAACSLPSLSAAGERLYWEEGLHFDPLKERFTIRIGGRIHADAGSISLNDDLDEAFPDLEGFHADFRRINLILSGALFHHLEYRLEMDFATTREVRDNWIRWTKFPFLGRFRLGHITEPFSLDELTSSNTLPFMEVSVPTNAFVPGRNIGVPYNDTLLDGRMSLAAGVFLITGSFSDVGEASDRISEANGWNLVGRLTGLPWYADDGRRLLHLGLNYCYFSYDDGTELRAFPETRLGEERLVDTGGISGAEEEHLLGLEAAGVYGPLTLKGETFLSFVDGEEGLFFWGGYLSGSWFLTGEHRPYNRTRGTFTMEGPQRVFRPRRGGWGAWELAARLSYADLGDGDVRGGRELNVTAGLNVYLGTKVRLMFEYIHAAVDDRLAEPAVRDGKADFLQSRFQFVF